jgi:hypothetical protein
MATPLKSPITSIFPSGIILPSGVISPSEVFSYLRNLKDHIPSLFLPQWSFDKTRMAISLKLPFISNIPSGIILLKIAVIKNFLKKSFPTSGITRITFCL